MRRGVLVAALSVAALGAGGAQVASAGQPNQDCSTVPVADQPPGFQTQGFANAESHYAGSAGTPSALHAQSGAAVAQYDVACVRRAAH
jgi:hypothetical protein